MRAAASLEPPAGLGTMNRIANRLQPRERVRLGHGDDDGFARKRERRHADRPLSHRRPDEADVEPPAVEVVDLLADIELMQAQLDVRIGLAIGENRLR
jgi:hypothetical protein